MQHLLIMQAHLIVMSLFLAGKDALSYKLKDYSDNSLTSSRLKRWHLDGVIIYLLAIVPWLTGSNYIFVVLAAILIRLSIFDLVFNHWSDLSTTYIGNTSWVDRIFLKIFGVQGAIKKSVVFFIILIIVNLCHKIFLLH